MQIITLTIKLLFLNHLEHWYFFNIPIPTLQIHQFINTFHTSPHSISTKIPPSKIPTSTLFFNIISNITHKHQNPTWFPIQYPPPDFTPHPKIPWKTKHFHIPYPKQTLSHRIILFKHIYIFIILLKHISFFLLIPTKIVCFISRIFIFYHSPEYSAELFRPTIFHAKRKAIPLWHSFP